MKRGFTLLELLIVIVIIGILAAVAMPRYFANVENARRAEAQSTLRALREADLAEFAKTGAYFTIAPTPANVWAVDIDDDKTVDISVTPNITNFPTYTIAGEGTTLCLQANPSAVPAGRPTYSMCVQSGRFGNTACPPGGTPCP